MTENGCLHNNKNCDHSKYRSEWCFECKMDFIENEYLKVEEEKLMKLMNKHSISKSIIPGIANNSSHVNGYPPYMPIDVTIRLIWAVLVMLDYKNIHIVNYIPNKSITIEFMLGKKKITRDLDISWAFSTI